jgi:3-phosphoshikimate 1-carboxyvinyltransferase
MHEGETTIHNVGKSDDELAALNIIQQLGAEVEYLSSNSLKVKGSKLKPVSNIIDCGESGLASRLFIPIIATTEDAITVTGKGSLLSRPMQPTIDTLKELGVRIESSAGKLPISLQGPLHTSKEIFIDGSLSSQYLSGLLFAICKCAKEKTTIHVKELKSKPYIDMTLAVLKEYGKEIQHDIYRSFHINPKEFRSVSSKEITVEGDWSSAAFIMAGAVINGDINLKGLYPGSLQADKAIVEVLRAAGGDIEYKNGEWHVQKAKQLKAYDFDATDCPDLFPVLSTLAIYCNGESNIQGIHRLIHKESNRLESIADMLEQLGVAYYVEDDILTIEGREITNTATIDSYNDHRIAMAAAIMAIGAKHTITIHSSEAISKSYPTFFDDLASLGITCSFQ